MKTLILVAVTATALASGAMAQTPDARLLAPINRFIDSFNKGDVAGAKATHANDAVILDEVPPYHWRGPKAFDTWVADLTAYDAKHGITNEAVKLGKVRRVETSGDRGYVVVSVVYSYKQRGASVAQPAEMVVSLASGAGGWKITSWAWSGNVSRKVGVR